MAATFWSWTLLRNETTLEDCGSTAMEGKAASPSWKDRKQGVLLIDGLETRSKYVLHVSSLGPCFNLDSCARMLVTSWYPQMVIWKKLNFLRISVSVFQGDGELPGVKQGGWMKPLKNMSKLVIGMNRRIMFAIPQLKLQLLYIYILRIFGDPLKNSSSISFDKGSVGKKIDPRKVATLCSNEMPS